MAAPHVVSTVLRSATSTITASVSAPRSSRFRTETVGVLLAARRAAAAPPLMPCRSA